MSYSVTLVLWIFLAMSLTLLPHGQLDYSIWIRDCVDSLSIGVVHHTRNTKPCSFFLTTLNFLLFMSMALDLVWHCADWFTFLLLKFFHCWSFLKFLIYVGFYLFYPIAFLFISLPCQVLKHSPLFLNY